MKISDYLNKDEVRYFTSRSDWLAWRTTAVTWASILAVFALVDTWTNPTTILLAIILLSGRQLALAVITHECGHHTLFRSEPLNRFVGQWLAANVSLQDMYSYAAGHSRHHQQAGTRQDPDLPNYQAYPVSADSFKRKVVRDLSGQTGIKLLRLVLRRAAGIFSGDAKIREAALPFAQQVAVNVVFALLLGLLFQAWIYLLWIASFLTTYMLILRIRQVAEHAAVPDLYDSDPRNNTRTTIPFWWERLIFAPNYVNYHLEHHFLASVPCYRLRELHQLLQERGAYADTRIFRGYREVLEHAIA
ncbi:MAG: fatty acid desaturase family protein [Gammaproteobacteria bacterium]|nr:fatty acid desaturase family protein [Gammaproteobacteria bacterium]